MGDNVERILAAIEALSIEERAELFARLEGAFLTFGRVSNSACRAPMTVKLFPPQK